MPKITKNTKKSSKGLPAVRFSETWLVVFAMIFATLGSYAYVRTYAATDVAGVSVQPAALSAEESAWFSSMSYAAFAVLAAGPIAAFGLWWVWRKSDYVLWLKTFLTVSPILAVMAFT